MIMPVTSMMPMLLRAPAPGPRAKTSGRWPITVAAVVIRIGPQPRAGRLDDGLAACPCPSPAAGWRTRTIRMPFFADQARPA